MITPSLMLPCPFCGQAPPHGDVEHSCRHVALVCQTCGARGPRSAAQGSYALRAEEAGAGWNCRTASRRKATLRTAAQAVCDAYAAVHSGATLDALSDAVHALARVLGEGDPPGSTAWPDPPGTRSCPCSPR
jgi:hypothetical protein